MTAQHVTPGSELKRRGHGERQSGAPEVPWNLVVPTVDVHLVGYGNRFPNDFTLEMLAVLKRCGHIFGAPPISAPGLDIPTMESVMHLYRRGKQRTETYREIAELVLDAAATDPPVAFATYGSAMVGMPPCHDILQQAARRGLTAHVTPSVSSFDGVWADLNLDPLLGFEVWEATLLVRLGVEPDTRANLLVPQVALLDIDDDRGPVAALRDHLLQFYPAGHLVHFVRTGSTLAAHPTTSDIETVPLSELDHPGREVLSTLLVPRVAPTTTGTSGTNGSQTGDP